MHAISVSEVLLGKHLLAYADHGAEFYSGSGNDAGKSITIDSSSDLVIAGETTSSNLPLSSAFQGSIGSMGSKDAFVARFNALGAGSLTLYGSRAPLPLLVGASSGGS